MDELTGLLLCGGKGTRMGGGKPWRLYRGQPLFHYPRATLQQFCGEVLAVGEELPGCKFVADELPGQGPLAGLLSGLKASATDWCLCLAVDMPRVRPEAVRTLLAAREPPAVTPRGEPLLALYHREAIPSLAAFLATGRRSARQWLATLAHREIEGLDPANFWNCNTPEDLSEPGDPPPA